MTRDLGDGLLLRRATAADTEALVAFTSDVLRYQDAPEPDVYIAAWARDLLSGGHPTVSAQDFVVVEDQRRRRIVSCAGLIAQTWLYDGIPIGVGNPELIGTHAEFRGRGLVRALLDVVHAQSAASGHQVQAIDGIPWFYRQFGYEMALALRGEVSVDLGRLPVQIVGACHVRLAVEADLPFIAAVCEAAAVRSLVSGCRDAASWHYEFSGRSKDNQYRVVIAVVETAGTPIGYIVHVPRLVGDRLVVMNFEVHTGYSWEAVIGAVLPYLRHTGLSYAGEGQPCDRVGFHLGAEHPIYPLLGDFAPRDDGAYAWYLRVRDLKVFLHHIRTVLQRRLASSAFAAHSGVLRLSFYRGGLQLAFARGQLVRVDDWQQSRTLHGIEKGVPTTAERADAYFPGMTFLQLLFGYRSLAELQHAFADCIMRSGETQALVTTLFPKLPSNVWPVL